MTITSPIATVSLAGYDRDPEAFAAELGQSFSHYGFAIVADHGIPSELIAKAEAMSQAFFALPEEVKRSYHVPGSGGARGYTPFGIEAAKGADKVDLKEFWHIGRELPAGHRYGDVMAPNLWPVEIEGFRETFLDLFSTFDKVGARLLEAIARYLGLAQDYFVDTVRDGNSVMRLLHYPPVSANAEGVRAGAHEDINTITLLLGAQESGLEAFDISTQTWLPVKPAEGQMVINVGDMLQRLTNNVLKSTSHRVTNPAPERRAFSRYSMPFFLHFRPDFMIETLPSCITAERPNLYPQPISSQDYLMERLREIRLA